MDEASVTTGDVSGSCAGRRFTQTIMNALTKARAERRRAERRCEDQAVGRMALEFLIHDALKKLEERTPLSEEQWEVLQSTELAKRLREAGRGLGVERYAQ